MLEKTLESTISEHLNLLAAEIGPRPVGSAGYERAQAHIRAAFERAGLHVEDVVFDAPGWEAGEVALTVGGEPLHAAANIFSPPCDVAAPLAAAGTLAELEAAEIGGRIVVLYGSLTAEPLIPLNCPVYNTERDQRVNRLLLERQPAAVLTVNPNPPATDARIEDSDFTLPSATVAAEAGRRLLESLGETAHLRIDSTSRPAQAVTLVGRTPGAHDARITLMAHYDTKHGTPGALDNAGGVAVLLALAERLAGDALPVGLEFVAFGDEEYFAETDGLYAERYADELPRIVLALNFDAVGQALGTDTITLMPGGSDALRAALDGVLRRSPGMIWADPWPQSNHSTFAFRGVPSVAFTAQGVNGLHHQPADRVEWASAGKLAEVAQVAAEIVSAVQGQPPGWSRG